MNKKEQQEELRSRGICVIIPTYNNSGTVGDVARRALEQCSDVYVVCDGCTDDTPQIVRGIEGLRVISYEKNRGKGYALKKGFEQALKDGFSYAITIDSDAQHKPEDIPLFLEKNKECPGSIIIGERDLTGVERSKGSNFANNFSNFWFWFQTGKRGLDTQSGYRLYPLKKIPFKDLVTNRYEAELEMLVFPSWHGVNLTSVPIDVYYPDPEERVSHFRPAKDFTRISVLNTFLFGMTLLYGMPLRAMRKMLQYGRTLYTILFTLFFSGVLITPGLKIYLGWGKVTEKKRRNVRKLIQFLARFVMLKHGIPGSSFSFKVAREDCFEKPAVIICNHQSHFDLMCQLVFTPNVIFLTKEWVWKNPLYGFMIRNAEYQPVKEGIEEIMPKLKELVEKGHSIAVYPEGSRSKDCKIRRFHQGAFYIAEELGLEILPMCIYGPGKVLPKGSKLMNPGPMYIEVGERITRGELEAMGDVKAQAREMRRRYVEWYGKMSNKIDQDV